MALIQSDEVRLCTCERKTLREVHYTVEEKVNEEQVKWRNIPVLPVTGYCKKDEGGNVTLGRVFAKMVNNKTPRRVIDLWLDERRIMRRPKYRWIESVVENLRELRDKKVAGGRHGYRIVRKIMWEVKAHGGMWCYWILKYIKISFNFIIFCLYSVQRCMTANISGLITILKWFTIHRVLMFNLTNPCLPSQYTQINNVLLTVTKRSYTSTVHEYQLRRYNRWNAP